SLLVACLITCLVSFCQLFCELSLSAFRLGGPVAEKLGIDLFCWGVLRGVNMHILFMPPPFGFALFYLRSVAPAKDYVDKVTKKLTAGVKTSQIYWGAVPFVIIQIIMVALVIALPQMVMVYKGKES